MFPNALAHGIREEIFWTLNPVKMKPYQEAERIKLKNQNFNNWLAGLYTHEAVAIAVSNAFRKKGTKAAEYPKEPHQIGELSEREKAVIADRERKKAIAFFTQMESRFKREQQAE